MMARKDDKDKTPKSVDITELQRRALAAESVSNDFIAEHRSIVEAIASTIASRGKLPTGVDFDDLVSWGMEGLIKAHQNYDDSKGTQFRTYAYYRIRGEIYDRVRREWQYRNPSDYQKQKQSVQDRIADVVEQSVETNTIDSSQTPQVIMSQLVNQSAMVCLMSLDTLGDAIGEMPNDSSENHSEEDHQFLLDELKDLTDEERRLVDLFYMQGMKQKEIADMLQYSNSKVSRLHVKVLEKLRRRLLRRLRD